MILSILLVVLVAVGIGAVLIAGFLYTVPAQQTPMPVVAKAPPMPMGPGMPPMAGPGMAPAGGGGMPGGMAGPGAGGPGMPGMMGGAAPLPVLKVGDPAPEIDGEDLDGKPMKLSEFRGKVVVLDFWGDWCPHCPPLYTYQNHLISRMKGQPFVLLGVNCDETKAQANVVVKKHKIAWRSWFEGGQMMNGPIFQSYGVLGVPTTFVIDKEGKIAQRFDGRAAEVLLDTTVDDTMALGEKRPADAPPHWQPGSIAFGKLGEEVKVGGYLVRSPLGYVLEKSEAAGRQTFLWKGPEQPGGGAALFQVSLSPAQPNDRNLEDVLEREAAGLAPRRVGWNFSAAERGDVKGLTFARVRWNLYESGNRWTATGVVYAGLDGDTLIRITARDAALPNGLPGDGAALTCRKAPK
jgi:peroxiredoxin